MKPTAHYGINGTIAKQMRAFGFFDVNVTGSGRNRVAEGSWVTEAATIAVKRIGTIDKSKPECALANLLEGLGKASREIHSKGSKGSRNMRRKRRR